MLLEDFDASAQLGGGVQRGRGRVLPTLRSNGSREGVVTVTDGAAAVDRWGGAGSGSQRRRLGNAGAGAGS